MEQDENLILRLIVMLEQQESKAQNMSFEAALEALGISGDQPESSENDIKMPDVDDCSALKYDDDDDSLIDPSHHYDHLPPPPPPPHCCCSYC